MGDDRVPGRRTAYLSLAILLALLGVFLFIWRRGGPDEQAGAEPKSNDSISATAPGTRGPAPRLRTDRKPPALAASPAEKPIIDSIELEKTSVCHGEENLVTVKAHTNDGKDDAYLVYKIGPYLGNPAPIRGERPDPEDDPAPLTVTVSGRNGVATTTTLPTFTVRNCMVPRKLVISSRLMPNTLDEFEFHARVMELGSSKRFVPERFEWKLGPVDTRSTEVPLVRHELSHNGSESLQSNFLITCTAVDKNGVKVVGRHVLAVRNSSFEHLAYKGIVLLKTSLRPRFPTLDKNGDVRQQVTLWHDHDKPVTITRAGRAQQPRGGKRAGRPERLDVRALIGARVIPPGRKLRFHVRFRAGALEDIFSVAYRVGGVSEDGWRALGGFSVMRPPDLPTKDKANPVVDPMMAAKIMKARELLEKKFVTDEDIWRLQREGAFAGLQPIPGYKPGHAPPTPPKGRRARGGMSIPTPGDPESATTHAPAEPNGASPSAPTGGR